MFGLNNLNIWVILKIIILIYSNYSEAQFSQDYAGVILSPYVKSKDPETGKFPPWSVNTYTLKEIKNMLELVSTKFAQISTYGSGASNSTIKYGEGDATGLIPIASAQINVEKQERALTVIQGIWRNGNTNLDDKLLNREVQNALESSIEANKIYNGTVEGLIFSSLFVTNDKSTDEAIDLINKYRNESNEANLKIGVQTKNCFEAVEVVRPEVANRVTIVDGDENIKINKHYLERLVNEVDFIICFQNPLPTVLGSSVENAATEMGKLFMKFTRALKKFNPKLKVIWETGWPSQGISENGSKNSGRNLQTYWRLMNEWAEMNNISVYFHEAFDQPWKIGNEDPTSPSGINGANSHFGFWTKVKDEDISKDAYQEKIIEDDSEGLSYPTIITIVIGCVLVPVIIFLTLRLHNAQKTIQKLTEEDIKEFEDGIQNPNPTEREDAALCVPYNKSFELDRNNFIIDQNKILGQGQFGTVFKGTIMPSNIEVAIKTPNKNSTGQFLKEMLKEIKLMIYIGQHENVVTILGAHTSKVREGTIMILSEFCHLGSLEDHLQSIPQQRTSSATTATYENKFNSNEDERYVNFSKPKDTSESAQKFAFIPNLIKWSYEIAVGMSYLSSKKVIHADLAVRNVLLNNKGIAKITDFGLSRRLYEYTEYVKSNQQPMPWRGMAPEALSKLSFTQKSDVWSYGVTLWEIFSLGTVPYPGLAWTIDFVNKVEEGLRLPIPKYAPQSIYDIMMKTWEFEPTDRPNFEELHSTLFNLRIRDEEY